MIINKIKLIQANLKARLTICFFMLIKLTVCLLPMSKIIYIFVIMLQKTCSKCGDKKELEEKQKSYKNGNK